MIICLRSTLYLNFLVTWANNSSIMFRPYILLYVAHGIILCDNQHSRLIWAAGLNLWKVVGLGIRSLEFWCWLGHSWTVGPWASHLIWQDHSLVLRVMRHLESRTSRSFGTNRSDIVENNYNNNLLSSCHVPGSVLIALDSMFHLILVITWGLIQKEEPPWIFWNLWIFQNK